MLQPDFEQKLLSETNFKRVVGIDEVGRGCLAGPVAIGAYVFSLDSNPLDEIDDSKKLSKKKREKVYSYLKEEKYSVRYGSVEDIDTKGIARVIEDLIMSIIDEWRDGETYFLVDGYFVRDFGRDVLVQTGGDATYYSIAAASIMAKVERDKYMEDQERELPGYGFAKHKGYGTKIHLDSIRALGPTKIHRRSYEPIRILTEQISF